VLLADGLIELTIREVHGDDIVTEVQVGGWLSDRKGISFPVAA
jgi:pyruvate kinase